MEKLLESHEAAELLGLSRRTLERFRCDGRGPKFLKLGRRVKYAESHLHEWLSFNIATQTPNNKRLGKRIPE